MNAVAFHGNMMSTNRNNAGRGVVLLLIVLTGFIAVLAGPLFCEGSIAWAQLDATRTQSAFRLVGTIEGGPFTGAVIDDTKNPQAFYRLNDKLPDESQIVKVQNNYIVLKWPDGTKMELYTTPGAGGGSVSAAPAAAPYAAPRQVDQPAPERSVETNRRPVRAQTNSSVNSAEGTAGGRPPRMDRQNPNQQDAQVQDPNKRKGVSRGRRNRPISTDDN